MIKKTGIQYTILLLSISWLLSVQGMAQCPVNPLYDDLQVCNTLYVTNTSELSSGSIDSLFWHFGEGDTVKVLAPPFDTEIYHVFSSEGNYNVSLTVFHSSGCNKKEVKPFQFYYPVADYQVPPVGCTEEEVQFNDLSTTGTGLIVSWEWDFDDGSLPEFIPNPGHTYLLNGTYNTSLTVVNSIGCADNEEKTILQDRPDAGFIADSVCLGIANSFIDTSHFHPLVPIINWQWDFGDMTGTSSLPNPNYEYSNHGKYEVQLTVESQIGCLSSAIDTILVDTLPIADFTFDVACKGLQTCFSSSPSIPNADSLIGWLWDFGGGSYSLLENPCHIFSSTGSYTVSLIVTNSDGCESLPTFHTVYVSSSPETDFTFSEVCFGDTTFFTNLTDTMGYLIDSWLWDFGDPASTGNNTSSEKHAFHIYTSPDQFIAKLTAVNEYGCSDSITKTVTVNSLPEALFQMADTVSSGFEFTIEDLSYSNGSVILNSYWDFGDGNTATNINPVIYTYENPGTYSICLTAEDLNGCSSMFCDSVVVMGPPIANFQYASDTTLETFFYDISTPAKNIVHWFWDFGDPTTTSDTISGVQNPMYIYPEEGFYEVCLWIFDKFGGTDVFCSNIYAGNAVIANFEEIGVCLGDTTYFIDYSSSPISAGFESWFWDFGDGEQMVYDQKIDTIPHKYAGPGIYHVKLGLAANINGFFMTDTLHKTIRIFEPPVCRIDSTGLGVCLNSPIEFTDLSGASTYDPIVNWFWDFDNGDTSVVQNPVYTYADTGAYNVQLIILTQHGCTDIDSVKAYSNFAPAFSFEVEHGCVNKPATFIPQYDSSKIIIVGWNWNFGDLQSDSTNPNTSTAKEPTHVFNRIQLYTVRMEMSALGCEGFHEKSILVYPIPYSQFSIQEDIGGVQGSMKFTNQSIYATSYLWDFGNGNTTTVPDPLEIYEKDSTYLVTLVSYNEYGCTDTSFSELLVFFKGLYFPNAFSPNNPNEAISHFEPKGINLSQYLVQVYDMRGNLMWESSELDENGSPTESWDGYCNGILMPSGMYVWQAYGVFKDGTDWEGQTFDSNELPKTKGVITLIR
ncbi:MAG: PKD domain-containing protein [Bacteroidales bacterium]